MQLACTSHITAAWNRFRQLLPIITNHGILLRNWGNIFSSCIRKSLLYGCKTRAASNQTICLLTSADNGMVHWICDIWLEQHIRTQELRKKLGTISVTEEIQWRRFRYFGHLQRMITNVWKTRINAYVISGSLPRGHPQLCWGDVITKDLRDFKIRKELTDKWVKWWGAIMPRKIQLQRVWPIRGG